MQNLIIEQGKVTPYVELNVNGVFNFYGKSIHEDPRQFYMPILNWVSDYSKQPANKTTMDINMVYLNSSSSKFMLQLLRLITASINNVVINWHYETGDEDIKETGEYLSSVLDFEFNILEDKVED